MGNLGAPEVLVIFLVALIVLGPNKLPEAARQVGKAINEIRRISAGFQREMRAAMEQPISEVRAEAQEARRLLQVDVTPSPKAAPPDTPAPDADPDKVSAPDAATDKVPAPDADPPDTPDPDAVPNKTESDPE